MIDVSLYRYLHFPRTFVRYGVVMNMSQKLLFQLLLGFFLSSVYLTTLLVAVHQQQFVHLSAEEINGHTLKAVTALDRSQRRY